MIIGTMYPVFVGSYCCKIWQMTLPNLKVVDKLHPGEGSICLHR